MRTCGDSPAGPCAVPAATGRPTYDGVTHAPGPGGIGTQPSGTTTATPPTASPAATHQTTTRRLGRNHPRTRGK